MELKLILEALLFSAQKALSPTELRETLVAAAQEEGESARALKRVKLEEIGVALDQLKAE